VSKYRWLLIYNNDGYVFLFKDTMGFLYMSCCIEYVWIGNNNELRSKTRVCSLKDICKDVPGEDPRMEMIGGRKPHIANISNWNYDGSSTGQATGEDSEVIIKPQKIFRDPFRGENDIIVMCDTYYPDEIRPLSNSKRSWAKNVFDQKLDEKPWFGLEQEYFLMKYPSKNKHDISYRAALATTPYYPDNWKYPIGFPTKNNIRDGVATGKQGQYYCSVGAENAFGRDIVEEHLKACIFAGIQISGINAEVAPGQWEFQIGPCEGIAAGDHLWVARYLLNRIAEKHGHVVSYAPKILSDWNGSGCHTNYSTKNMREGVTTGSLHEPGLNFINTAISKLSHKHNEHMKLYGSGNNKRMTGGCETASFETFSDGVANRGASIRRGNKTVNDKQGYFEDRRPSSNCDPYLVTAKIFSTTILE
jgi:glutamine synthetase